MLKEVYFTDLVKYQGEISYKDVIVLRDDAIIVKGKMKIPTWEDPILSSAILERISYLQVWDKEITVNRGGWF